MKNSYGTVGFVLSLSGLVLGLFPYGIIITFVFSAIALVFCAIQLKKQRTGFAIAGLVISIIGILQVLLNLITFIWARSFLV